MKALSLIQPYATLIMLGYKQYETRSWDTNNLEGEALAMACDMAVQKLRPVPTPVHDAEALEQLAQKYPINLPWMKDTAGAVEVDVLLSKRALKALSFQERVSLCDEVRVHFSSLEAVLQQPGAQQSSLTAVAFSQLVQLATARHEIVAQVLSAAQQPAPMPTEAELLQHSGRAYQKYEDHGHADLVRRLVGAPVAAGTPSDGGRPNCLNCDECQKGGEGK